MIGKQHLKRTWFYIIIAFLLLSNSTAILADDSNLTPDKILNKATDELLVVIEKDKEKIKNSPEYVYEVVTKYLVPHIDFVSAARWVLGKHERDASLEQKKQFILEFRTLMIRFYASALREYLINSESKITKDMIQYRPVALKEGETEAIVRSEIIPSNGKRVPVHFHMHLKRGKWKIFDVSVEGVSVVTTYRTSFSSQIRKKGLDEVIAALKKRNSSLTEAVTLTNNDTKEKAN
ncbi:MAG: phospholipid-binding protein MlaC [Gammaproteobacteria bacterium]